MAMERTERPERPMNRDRRPRRKVCAFCADKIEMIDYKDTQRLRRYLRLPAVKSTRTPCPCGGVFLHSAPLMGTCLTFTPPYV